MLYGAALTPVLLADLPLLCAVLGLYCLQFALESITGQHRFLSAMQNGSVLSACYTSTLGTPKVVLAGAALLCKSVVVSRFTAARRGQPIRRWWEALPVLHSALSVANTADVVALLLCAALSLVTLALSEPDVLCRWFGNLLLVLWGVFGLRFMASSLLQVRSTRALVRLSPGMLLTPLVHAAVAGHAGQEYARVRVLPWHPCVFLAVRVVSATPACYAASLNVSGCRLLMDMRLLKRWCCLWRASRRAAARSGGRADVAPLPWSPSRSAKLAPVRPNRTAGPLSPDGFEVRPQGHSGSVRRRSVDCSRPNPAAGCLLPTGWVGPALSSRYVRRRVPALDPTRLLVLQQAQRLRLCRARTYLRASEVPSV